MKKIDPEKEYLPSEVAAGGFIPSFKYNQGKKHPIGVRHIRRLCEDGLLVCRTEIVLKQKVLFIKGSDILLYRETHKRKKVVRRSVNASKRKKLSSRVPKSASL